MTHLRRMNSVQEKNLAAKISSLFKGELVTSTNKHSYEVDVRVERINNLQVNIDFTIQGQLISFKGHLIENGEGTLMMVQEKIMNYYVLNGHSGFMYDMPNVHGGFISRLDGFYFHIQLNHYTRDYEEFYFFGKAA